MLWFHDHLVELKLNKVFSLYIIVLGIIHQQEVEQIMANVFIQHFKYFFKFLQSLLSVFNPFTETLSTFRSTFLIASFPITGVVSTSTNACPLLTRHRQNTNKMFRLLLRMY